jgi:hypothetical protein
VAATVFRMIQSAETGSDEPDTKGDRLSPVATSQGEPVTVGEKREGFLGASRLCQSTWMAPLLYVGVLALIFGYEIFSFHLSMDEARYSATANTDMARGWLAQGRWFSALLSLTLPTTVTPVVATLLGVAMSGSAWWLIARRIFQLNRVESLLTASMAAAAPVLSFTFAYTILAAGVGVASLLVFLSAYLLGKQKWYWLAASALAGSAAMGVYEPFFLALVVVLLGWLAMERTLLAAGKVMAVLLGSYLVSFLMTRIGWHFVPQSPYVDRFLDPSSALSDISTELRVAASNVLAVVDGSAFLPIFSTPVAVLLLLLMLVLGAWGVVKSSRKPTEGLLGLLAILGVVLAPLIAEIVTAMLYMRSKVYMPFGYLVLGSLAFLGLRNIRGRVGQFIAWIVAVGVLLAVLAGATFANRLYAMSALAYEYDQMMAYEINREITLQLGGKPPNTLSVAVAGNWDMNGNASSLWLRRELADEAHGSSFFYRMPPMRVGPFLSSQGVNVKRASPEQEGVAKALLAEMPPWPQPGWLDIINDLVLIKFS